MKKILENRILQLCCVLVMLLLVACDPNESNGPVLTGVRNYAASPDDSVLQTLQPGQWVILEGQNLSNATQIFISGVPVPFNNSLFSDSYAVVQVPEIIPFPLIPAEKLNTIQYVTNEGSTTFSFDISVPAPTITAISNENANAGDMVAVYGTNLFLITSLTYAGTEITEYETSTDGTFVTFILPEITASGPVVVQNKSGKFSTVFNVNEPGVMCNFDDVNTLSWGPSTDNSGTTFPSNRGYYAILKNDGLTAGNWSWWEGGRSINTNGVQWVPVDSLDLPVDSYAVKFEINVPQKWNGTSLFVVKDYNWTYLARFEPWDLGNGKTSAVSTNGYWLTITIPLSEFRTKADGKDGTGVPASSLKTLLGDSGNGSFNIFTVNAGEEAAPALNMAVDNIRVVKIK
jgi:hypothetical protein